MTVGLGFRGYLDPRVTSCQLQTKDRVGGLIGIDRGFRGACKECSIPVVQGSCPY